MLIVRRRAATALAPDLVLELAFEDRRRTRLRTQAASGEEVALFLDRGSVLRHGERLQADDGRVLEIVAAHEALLEVETHDAAQLARAAYHLGNRHAVVEIGPARVRCPADPTLARMLETLGVSVHEIRAPFAPEPGAYAAGHTHGGHHRGVIHDRAAAHSHPEGHSHDR